MGGEREAKSSGKKALFEQLLEKAQDQRSGGAYMEALKHVSQAIELAPDVPHVVANPEIFVNILVQRSFVYKDLNRYPEAFADLDAAENIIGIQNETLLREK